MSETIDKYGKLTIIQRGLRRHGKAAVLVRCECGTEKIVMLGNLKIGSTQSCGCHRKQFHTWFCRNSYKDKM